MTILKTIPKAKQTSILERKPTARKNKMVFLARWITKPTEDMPAFLLDKGFTNGKLQENKCIQ